MFCSSCGKPCDAGSKFCSNCGHPTAEPIQPTSPTTPEIEKIQEFKQSGDLESARDIALSYVRSHPENSDAWLSLAKIEEELGHRELAIRAMERVVLINPSSLEDRIRLDTLRGRDTAIPIPVPVRRDTVMDWRSLLTGVSLTLAIVAVVITILSTQRKPVDRYLPSHTVTPQQLAENSQAAVNRQQPPVQSANPATPPPQIVIEREQPVINRYVTPPPIQPVQVLPNEARIAPQDNHVSKKPNKVVIDIGSTDKKQSNNSDSTNDSSQQEIVDIGALEPVSGNSPDHTSSSYLALGQEEQEKGHYNRAISAYSSALPTAGDETAYIDQQIAICYQNLSNKQSAISFYQKAITAYKSLLRSGHETSIASSGITACQAGIKICSI